MKMKVSDLLSSQQALQQFGSTKFPIQVSLSIASNNRLINEAAKEYDDRRIEIVKRLGKIDKESGQTTVLPENQQKFTDEINKLTAEEVDLDLKTVSLKDLGLKYEVEPNVVMFLNWMITMEGQKPTRRKK